MPWPLRSISVLILVAGPLLATVITSVTGYYGGDVFIVGPLDITVIDTAFIALSVAYGLFPILYNKFGLLEKHAGYTAREYRIVGKILLIEIPVLVLATLYYFLLSTYSPEPYYAGFQDIILSSAVLSIIDSMIVNLMYFLLYSVAGGLLWIAFMKINKEFYFYLARGSFENMLEKNEIEKVGSMKIGLGYYNRYLEKVLGLKINNIDGVTSKLLTDSKIHREEAIKSIYHAFEEKDKFRPITCISTTLDIQETEKFLIRQSVGEKITYWMAYIVATIIPLVVAVIQLLFPPL